jgi:ribosome-associated heat shock protein Hsp15
MSGRRATGGGHAPGGEQATGGGSLRLDRWLWHARACRTRSAAARLAASGQVRLNGQPTAKAHQAVRPGDVLTFPQGHHIRVWKVLALAERRVGAADVAALYEDLKPPQPENRLPRDTVALAAPAPPGRPDKQARRQLRALRDRE